MNQNFDPVYSFVSHGYEYGIDSFGVIHQMYPSSFNYDKDYISTYDRPEYQKGNQTLQALRIGFVNGVHGSLPKNILDIGYGNGAFLKFCKQFSIHLMGKDVTGQDIDGIEIVHQYKPADVYTFWDVLEHIPDHTFLKEIPCKTLVVSLPWCHYKEFGQNWFDNQYKHRKPDEHIHHFDRKSLEIYMRQFGWYSVGFSNFEDAVRRPTGDWENILTMAFKR